MSKKFKNSSVVKPAVKIPRYCLHKPTGRAIVYIARKPYYLGRSASANSPADLQDTPPSCVGRPGSGVF